MVLQTVYQDGGGPTCGGVWEAKESWPAFDTKCHRLSFLPPEGLHHQTRRLQRGLLYHVVQSEFTESLVTATNVTLLPWYKKTWLPVFSLRVVRSLWTGRAGTPTFQPNWRSLKWRLKTAAFILALWPSPSMAWKVPCRRPSMPGSQVRTYGNVEG